MRVIGALAAAAAALLLIPGTALAADPPPGAVKSDNLEYVKWDVDNSTASNIQYEDGYQIVLNWHF